jgi:site-specific recombinase XerD
MPTTKIGSLEWANAIASWSASSRRDLGANLLLIYQAQLNRFSAVFAKHSPWLITACDIDTYLDGLSGPKVASQQVNARLALGHFYKWAEAEGLVESNPANEQSTGCARQRVTQSHQGTTVNVDVSVVTNPMIADKHHGHRDRSAAEQWDKALADYSDDLLARGLMPSTVDTYVNFASQLRNAFSHTSPWKLTSVALNSWLQSLDLARQQTLRRRQYFSYFFTWAMGKGLIDTDPTANLTPISSVPVPKRTKAAKPKTRVSAKAAPTAGCPWCSGAVFDTPKLMSIAEAWRQLVPVGQHGDLDLYRVDDLVSALDAA